MFDLTEFTHDVREQVAMWWAERRTPRAIAMSPGAVAAMEAACHRQLGPVRSERHLRELEAARSWGSRVNCFEGIAIHVDDRLEDDEWLLCPAGTSPHLAVYAWVNGGRLRRLPRMHGLREAAMEVEP